MVVFGVLVVSCKAKEPPPEPQSLTVLSYGGEFADAQRIAFFAPFTQATGSQIIESTYGGEYGRIKADVEGGGTTWDIVDLESSALRRAVADSLLVPIDYSTMSLDSLYPGAKHQYAVATDFYSVSLGYNTKSFPEPSTAPRNWRDFWDVKRFPGARSMKKDPRFSLEIALMADGVPIDSVYVNDSLDVERAFRSLARIKRHVRLWWSSGQEAIQALAAGEVVMAAAFGARMFNAAAEGKPVQTSWDQGVLDIEYWAIPRTSTKRELALRFIEFASTASAQARFALAIPLGPMNAAAFDSIPAERGARLNTHPDNIRRQLLFNADFWARNEAAVLTRFNAWLLAR